MRALCAEYDQDKQELGIIGSFLSQHNHNSNHDAALMKRNDLLDRLRVALVRLIKNVGGRCHIATMLEYAKRNWTSSISETRFNEMEARKAIIEVLLSKHHPSNNNNNVDTSLLLSLFVRDDEKEEEEGAEEAVHSNSDRWSLAEQKKSRSLISHILTYLDQCGTDQSTFDDILANVLEVTKNNSLFIYVICFSFLLPFSILSFLYLRFYSLFSTVFLPFISSLRNFSEMAE